MAEHVLKCWANYYDAIRDGRKRFEWRRDDRGYEVGDVLVLRRFEPGSFGGDFSLYRGAPVEQRVRVTYILRGMWEVPTGYCVMSIEPEKEPSE